jgi:hypothetical protein
VHSHVCSTESSGVEGWELTTVTPRLPSGGEPGAGQDVPVPGPGVQCQRVVGLWAHRAGAAGAGGARSRGRRWVVVVMIMMNMSKAKTHDV